MVFRMKKRIIIFLLLFSMISNARAYNAEVTDISSREYFKSVKTAIDSAQESIYMSMFVIALRPEHEGSVVHKLCDALIDAKKRGVMVKVILDQNINYYEDKSEIEGKNTEAYNYLLKNGIEVSYDSKHKHTVKH